MTKEEIQKNSEHWYNKYKEVEKRIEELEKDKQYFSDSLDKQIETTLKLDKENAELKEKCETLEDMIDEGISYQKAKDYDGVVTSLLEQNHLVTKAKTYLKYFIEILKKLGVDKEPLVIEAEQFLKYSEVKK